MILIEQNKRAAAMVKLKKKELDMTAVKIIVTHLNTPRGKCHRCNNNKLVGELVVCSQCKAFNFNW